MTYNTDVLIIGAGAVGTAIARELSKFKLDVILCDKNDDVGGDASKSCSSCCLLRWNQNWLKLRDLYFTTFARNWTFR